MADTIPHLPGLEANAVLQLAFWRRIAWQYGLAIVAIAVGVGVKLAFDSVLRGEASYVLFVPAVLIASALGGWGPGLLATALGIALGLFFVAQTRQLAAADAVIGLVSRWSDLPCRGAAQFCCAFGTSPTQGLKTSRRVPRTYSRFSTAFPTLWW